MTEEEQHRIDVVKSLHSSPQHVALCSCGWVGRSMKTEAEAEQDGDEHIIAVT